MYPPGLVSHKGRAVLALELCSCDNLQQLLSSRQAVRGYQPRLFRASRSGPYSKPAAIPECASLSYENTAGCCTRLLGTWQRGAKGLRRGPGSRYEGATCTQTPAAKTTTVGRNCRGTRRRRTTVDSFCTRCARRRSPGCCGKTQCHADAARRKP